MRVIPRSSQNAITQDGNAFKVRITAPPVYGAVNEALLKLLAKRLGVPKRSLHIVQGTTGRQKVIQVDDLTGLNSGACLRLLSRFSPIKLHI